MQKVTVTDPAFRTSRYVAVACQSVGSLDRYVTSFVYNPDGMVGKAVRLLPGSQRRSIERHLKSRTLDQLDTKNISLIPLPEAGALIARRIVPQARMPRHRLMNWQQTVFDGIASRGIPESSSIVYANEGSALLTFKEARQRGKVTILHSTQHPDQFSRILGTEYDRFGLPLDEREYRFSKVKAELALSDYVVTQSEFTGQSYVEAGWPRSRVIVIPNGVNLASFTPAKTKRAKGNRFRILYVGTISVRKGIERLITAVGGLDPKKYELVVIGSVTDEFSSIWARLLAAASATFPVSWIGPIPRHELVDQYRKADLLVLPSLLESFGNVVLEAMACGTAVLVTTACGIQVRDGIDGFVVAPGNTEALTEAIELAREDRDYLNQIAEGGLQRSKEFSWEQFQSEIQAFLSSIDLG